MALITHTEIVTIAKHHSLPTRRYDALKYQQRCVKLLLLLAHSGPLLQKL